jgi:hypothetical protein
VNAGPTNTNMKTTHPHACERTRRLHPKRHAAPPQRPSSDTPVHINQFYTARDQRYSFFSAPKDAPKMQAGRASPLPALLCSGRNRDSERAHPRRQKSIAKVAHQASFSCHPRTPGAPPCIPNPPQTNHPTTRSQLIAFWSPRLDCVVSNRVLPGHIDCEAAAQALALCMIASIGNRARRGFAGPRAARAARAQCKMR